MSPSIAIRLYVNSDVREIGEGRLEQTRVGLELGKG